MTRAEQIRPGAIVRHMMDGMDTEREVLRVDGFTVWVQDPGGGEPQPTLMGEWVLVRPAPSDKAA